MSATKPVGGAGEEEVGKALVMEGHESYNLNTIVEYQKKVSGYVFSCVYVFLCLSASVSLMSLNLTPSTPPALPFLLPSSYT